jgi:TPR repeat protein
MIGLNCIHHYWDCFPRSIQYTVFGSTYRHSDAEREELLQAATAGQAEANFKLGVAWLEGTMGRVCPETALGYLVIAANSGHGESQFCAGLVCRNPRWMSSFSPRDSFKWLLQSADSGNPNALNALGFLHATGRDVVPIKQNYAEAARLFRLAADLGDGKAQCSLGLLYATGRGVEEDQAHAVSLYEKALDSKDGMAKDFASYLLGLAFETGNGVAQDLSKAGLMYTAIRFPDMWGAEFEFRVGRVYLSGVCVPRDVTEAVRLITSAANQNNADAQHALGTMYRSGEGVLRDFIKAYGWLNIAAVSDHQLAKADRDLLESKMTRQQIADGQKFSRRLEKELAESRRQAGVT